jgi:pilus assembly protein CpaF
VAVGPPASRAWVLTIRKRGRVEGSVEELVRAGSMSRSMADFLEACVIARCNLLVVGSGPGTVSSVLSALASTSPTGQRIAVLHEGDEIVVVGSDAIGLWDVGRGVDAERLGSVASRLGVDRLVIASLGSAAGLTTLDAIGEGCVGVLAGYGAPTLRHGLARLAARLSLARPGISSEAASEAVASSFDIGVEVAREASGKLVVHRISEVCSVDPKGSGPRDVFVSSLDAGAVSFVPTGVTPKVAQDFAARGIKVDASMFIRSQ